MRARSTLLAGAFVWAAAGCGDAGRILGPEPPALPDSIAGPYRHDAIRLALRDNRVDGSLRHFPIEVPETEVDARMRALAWVYHSTGAARDSVVELFPVHTYPIPPLFGVVLDVDEHAPWVNAWRQGTTLTGNPTVDDLLTRYQVVLVDYLSTGQGRGLVSLRAGRPLNTEALGAALESVAGVLASYPNGIGGSIHTDIGLESVPDGWRVTYEFGWGDCLAGCIERHYWRFGVTREGEVRLLVSWGSDLATHGS